VFTVSSPLEVSPATVTESCALGTTSTTVIVTNHASAAVMLTGTASAS
jgi:hypothetical protein